MGQDIIIARFGRLAIRHPFPIRIGTPKACLSRARAGVAQLVERKALNLVVKGSSPFFGDWNFFATSLTIWHAS